MKELELLTYVLKETLRILHRIIGNSQEFLLELGKDFSVEHSPPSISIIKKI